MPHDGRHPLFRSAAPRAGSFSSDKIRQPVPGTAFLGPASFRAGNTGSNPVGDANGFGVLSVVDDGVTGRAQFMRNSSAVLSRMIRLTSASDSPRSVST